MNPKAILATLFAINLLNYTDRQILYAVFPLLQRDLGLTDTHLGMLGSAFMLVYMLAAPVIGYWADRTPRQIWISATAFLWSAATAATGLAANYWHLLAARGFIGVGEAGFTSVSPSFIAERFPATARARALAFYGAALPVGSALGYLLGATLGQYLGWRHVFWICGLPGLFLAALVILKIKDTRPPTPAAQKPRAKEYFYLLRNKSFLFICLGEAMATFTLGGLAAWMPTYIHRYFGYSVAKAGIVFGLLTIVAGFIGTAAGGIIADRLMRRTKKAYFATAIASFCLALPFGLGAVLAGGSWLALALLGAAVALIFLQTAPMQAAIVAVTDVKVRSMAFALNIFIIHALGDALSPALIGGMSDIYSLKFAILCAMLFIIPAAIFTCLAARNSQ